MTAISVALLSPLLGAIADRSGYRKRFLVSSAIRVTATASLPSSHPGRTPAIVVFVIANIAFEMGVAFYDSFLPDLVAQDKIGRVSAFGWGLGNSGRHDVRLSSEPRPPSNDSSNALCRG